MSHKQGVPQESPDVEIVLSFRVGEIDHGAFQPRHVDVHLTASQRRAMKRLVNAWRGVPLNGGRLVQSGPDVIRRILELVEDQANQALGVAASKGSSCR